jgi:glycosyltransferase involved in cell wall biosynthesis
MTPPFFTVVMGVYDIQEFVAAAVHSVLSQTDGDFELIVVDDGSTDGTADRVASFTDPRLRLVRAAHRGSAAARNQAIAMATGEWVAFLDGDDLWEPEKLARYRAFLPDRPELDICYDRARFIDEQGKDLGYRSSLPQTAPAFESLLIQNTIACGSVTVVRRRALNQTNGFCPELPAAIDLDLWLRIVLLREHNIAFLPEVLTAYRRRAGQISGKWRRMERGRAMMLRRLEAVAPGRVGNVKAKANVHFDRYLAYLAHDQGETLLAWRHMARSLKSDPVGAFQNADSRSLLGVLTVALFVPVRVRRILRRAYERVRQ